jgi:hypothetical protein
MSRQHSTHCSGSVAMVMAMATLSVSALLLGWSREKAKPHSYGGLGLILNHPMLLWDLCAGVMTFQKAPSIITIFNLSVHTFLHKIPHIFLQSVIFYLEKKPNSSKDSYSRESQYKFILANLPSSFLSNLPLRLSCKKKLDTIRTFQIKAWNRSRTRASELDPAERKTWPHRCQSSTSLDG